MSVSKTLVDHDDDCEVTPLLSSARSKHSGHVVGALLALTSAVMFATTAVFVKLSKTPAVMLILIRFSTQLLFTLCVAMYAKAPVLGAPETRKLLLIRAALGSAGLIMKFYSYKLIPIAEATVLTYTSPILASICACLFLKEPFGWFESTLLSLTLSGVILITDPVELASAVQNNPDAPSHIVGCILAMGVSLCSAVIAVLLRKLKNTHWSVPVVWHGAMGFILSFVAVAVTGEFVWISTWSEAGYCTGIAVFGYLASVLLTRALQLTTANTATLIRSSEVAFSEVYQVCVFNEMVTLLGGLGTACISCSVILSQLKVWIKDKIVLCHNHK